MDLYLLRHGEAEPRTTAVAEAARELTPKGREDVRRVIKLARGVKLAPDVILTSPYARARATAEIAAKVLGVAQIRESRSLLPNAKPEAIWKELQTLDSSAQVLLVGHEPHLSNLLAFLIGVTAPIEIKKGALLRVRVNGAGDVPEGQLKWLLPPSLTHLK